MRTTKFVKTAEVEKKWILIDAEDVVVGRLATFIAMRLRGKHLPTYTPHIDHGDNVITLMLRKLLSQARSVMTKFITGTQDIRAA